MYAGILGNSGKVNFPMFIKESSNVGLLNVLFRPNVYENHNHFEIDVFLWSV